MNYDEEGNPIEDDAQATEDVESDEFLDLLNGEPDGDEDDGDEDDGNELDPKDGDSIEVLKTKLAAKNRIIRQREKTNKRMQKELESRKDSGNNDQLAELVKAIKGGDEGEEQSGELNIEQLKEQFEDDPSSVVDLMFKMNQQLEGKLAKVLQDRDAFLEQKLVGANSMSSDDKMIIDRLKARPEYADFTDEQMKTVLKTLKPIRGKVRRAPASIRSGNLPLNASTKDVEKVNKSALEAMGYGEQ